MTHRRERGEVLAMMLKLAAGPEGLTNSALAARLETAQSNIAPRINQAAANGHLHRSQRRGYPLHWFETAERAQEWAKLPPPHKPQKLTAAVKKPIQKPVKTDLRFGKKPGPKALTDYHAEKHTAGASKLKALQADTPVSTDGVPYTYTPAPRGQFEPLPEEVEPVFASMGIGRYLEVRA